jgi:putative intracellular protease/amidase
MKIQLKKAWLIKGTEVTCGWGFEPETLNDGTIERDNEKFFTKDGKNFVRANWSAKVLFDERHAQICAEDNAKSDIKYAKEQIEYYTKKLLDAGGEL